MSRVLKLTLAYDGTAYVGWQRQAEGVSIQGLIEDALTRLDGAPVTVHGAGRTDAGVHAFGQVASARVITPREPPVIRRALNAMLPGDVRVLDVEDAAPDFHARYQRRRQDLPVPDLAGRRAAAVRQGMELAPAPAAGRGGDGSRRPDARGTARLLGVPVGRQRRAIGRADGDLRAGRRARAGRGRLGRDRRRHGQFVIVRIAADGFLRHMVRAIAGTLVEVGEARRDVGVGGCADRLARPGRVGSHGAGPRPRPGSRDVLRASSRGLIARSRASAAGPAVACARRSLYHELLRSPGEPHGA